MKETLIPLAIFAVCQFFFWLGRQSGKHRAAANLCKWATASEDPETIHVVANAIRSNCIYKVPETGGGK